MVYLPQSQLSFWTVDNAQSLWYRGKFKSSLFFLYVEELNHSEVNSGVLNLLKGFVSKF